MKIRSSIKFNFIMNTLKTLMTILFPIISFPYASRILGTEGIGAVNYAESIISYFTLFAGLGIVAYGTREAARVRDDKEKLSKLSAELLIINLITTLIAYIFLGIFLNTPYFSNYFGLLIIHSAVIICNTLGIEWFFVAIEDYAYITVRSVIFQIIALISMFLFVKDMNDYLVYAFLNVFASVGSGIINFFYSRKYISIFKRRKLELRKHIKPVLIIFSANLASAIYLNLDKTMLGAMEGNTSVGLYTAASKIMRAVSTLMACISNVILPRLSYYLSCNDLFAFHKLIKKAGNLSLLISVPASIGLACVSKALIPIFCGIEFTSAYTASIILSISICLSAMNRIFIWQVLIPMNNEIPVFIATSAGAVVNLVLNFIFIPLLSVDGAAWTVVFAELTVFIIGALYSRKLVNIKEIFADIYQYIIGGLSIIIVSIICDFIIQNSYILIIAKVIISSISYSLILIAYKNEYGLEILKCVDKLFKKITS